MKTTSKIFPPLQIFFAPLPLRNYLKFFLMTSHRDSHTTTDFKPEMIPGLKTGNGIPHNKYNIRGIVHTHTNRKDNIFMQRRLYNDKAHTVLDIFPQRCQDSVLPYTAVAVIFCILGDFIFVVSTNFSYASLCFYCFTISCVFQKYDRLYLWLFFLQ